MNEDEIAEFEVTTGHKVHSVELIDGVFHVNLEVFIEKVTINGTITNEEG